MKNIEKYTNTKDALEAYNTIGDKFIPLDVWLELEYKEPSPPSLMEAAEAVKNIWYAKMPASSLLNLQTSISNLADAIEREKAKPVRKCDKYRTSKDALAAIHDFMGYAIDPIEERILTVNWLLSGESGVI